ncbi:Ubinuclein conserved middle domain-containing protein [Dichotomocladium elegans]|nr:Ubinuclein conserved middle domain-containing protein [Dichotomocladium elegans]
MTSNRFEIPIKNQQFPVIFSYRDLVKSKRKEIGSAAAAHMLPSADIQQDDFFANLLERAKHYSLTDPGDDVEDNEDSEDEEEGSPDRTKRVILEEYDYDDPFIDDSDLLFEDTQTSQHPEYDGWFVYHGPLDGTDLLGAKKQDKSKATPAKKKAPVTKPKEKLTATTKQKEKGKKPVSALPTSLSNGKSAEAAVGQNTASSSPSREPIVKKPVSVATAATASTVSSSAAPPTEVGLDKKKGSNEPASSSKKKVSSSETRPLSPQIQKLLEKLKQDAQHENFEYKAKFPQRLRPTTLEIGRLMYRERNAVDSNVITHLMSILPYNRFTLTKFLTTKTGSERVKELQLELNDTIAALKAEIDRLMPKQNQQHSGRVAAAMAAAKQTQETSTGGSVGSNPAHSGEDAASLAPKFKWSEETRRLLYQILKLDQTIIYLSNDIASYTKEEMIKEVKARKQIYLRLVSLWPEGWVTTQDLSRQHSTYKAKVERSRQLSSGTKSGVGASTLENGQDARTAAKRESEPHPDEREPKRSSGVIVIPDDPEDNHTTAAVNPIAGLTSDQRPQSMAIESLMNDNAYFAPEQQ